MTQKKHTRSAGPAPKTAVFMMRMEEELRSGLDKIAKQRGEPRSLVIREACREYVRQHLHEAA